MHQNFAAETRCCIKARGEQEQFALPGTQHLSAAEAAHGKICGTTPGNANPLARTKQKQKADFLNVFDFYV